MALALGAGAAPAHATFPFPATAPSGSEPSEVTAGSWKLAATPEPGNEPNNSDPQELGGVRGASVADIQAGSDVAWQVTTGRPDVEIAVLDSGIEWNDPAAMSDLRRKVHLNTGELPVPNHDGPALVPGVDCSTYADAYDADGNGVVNVDDYACDSRVSLTDPRRAGPAGVLTPQDLIIAFSDGTDADGNGFVDDIAGWDFLDNDNDPFDDVSYGHGTGEARDSTAEAGNRVDDSSGNCVSGCEVGTCPNCTFVPLRVGDSFIADVQNFAQAVLYATDNGASIVQEALGTLNNSSVARDAILYAYRHDVTIVASWADEAAEHRNLPAALDHMIVVNSVTKYNDPLTSAPRSYLQLNGCTNFSPHVTMSVPSSSCSSEATGMSAGMAGLVYSAAEQAHAAGRLDAHPGCARLDGRPCLVTPNEVRQILATGTLGGVPQADDVNFATAPEPTCTPVPAPGCTDPNAVPGKLAVVSPLAETHRYPARHGPDEFYGYGRVNAFRAVSATDAGHIPPEAELTAPDSFAMVDPAQAELPIHGEVGAVRSPGGAYTCRLEVAPGAEPNNGGTGSPSDFAAVDGGFCDGTTTHTDPYAGVLGTVSIPALKTRFPATAGDFGGREPGTGAQTSNGRPNTQPYAFTVRVVVSATAGDAPATGEDRRELFLHRDHDLLAAWPRRLGADGASPPLLADLDGDNRNELVLGTSDGEVHAFRRDGSELPGWPVRTDPVAAHTGERAYAVGGEPVPHGALLASTAVADLNGDGSPEVVAADLRGKVYVWDAGGHLLWQREADPRFSGRPLTPFVNERRGKRDRTQHGFLGSPVVADIDGDGRPEVVIAGMDRHLYAFRGADGATVPGFPALVVDRTKVASIDPQSDEVRFLGEDAIGKTMDQGSIVDTPAIGDLDGDGRPEIVIGTNEEYEATKDGGLNAGPLDAATLTALDEASQGLQAEGQDSPVTPGNSRLYAFGLSGGALHALPGWPVKVGQLFTQLLPVVGEGITGSPILGTFACQGGAAGRKVGVISDAGPAYIFDPSGSSCLGKDPSNGMDRALASDEPGPGSADDDMPAFPAVGQPAFGDLGTGTALLAPVAGLQRALDLAVPEYQGGHDAVGAWDPTTGKMHPGFPATVNDLEFLSGPAVADVDGKPGEEVVAGTASLDLAAFDALGAPVSTAWPKFTGDWVVATPAIGSFGTLDTSPDARKVVVNVTRLGAVQVYDTAAPACSPASWPRFHHDPANSGDAQRDAVAPGSIEDAGVQGRTLSWTAPGDDGLCGRVDHYELRGADGTSLGRAPGTAGPGQRQSLDLPPSTGAAVALWAVDDQGNRDRAVTVPVSAGAASGGGAGGSQTTATGRRGCLASPLRLRSRSIGPARLGARRAALRRALPGARVGRRTVRACVRGGHRLLVALARGRAQLVATTARTVSALRPGMRLRARAARGLRRLAGLRGVLRRGSTLVGVRRGRVRWVAIATTRRVRLLRRDLRAVGLRA